MRTILICMLFAVTAYAQYDAGPAPPRLNIPGAIPLGGPIRQGSRQSRIQQAGPAPGTLQLRVRRPGLARPSFKSVDAPSRPNLQLLDELAKPVTEEPEDDSEINTPTAFSPNYISTPEPQNDFFDFTTTSQPKPPIVYNPVPIQQSTPKFEPVRPTQYRPLLAPQAFTPARHEIPARLEIPSKPSRIQQLSNRPQRPIFRPETKPFIIEDEEETIQPVRQYTRPQNQEPPRSSLKPAPQKYVSSNSREKKPVAQILRKYREENEDGSITWGFENDDGSFKEETIGVDCITRGKYGYVDPDGLKREYNYETGIRCDKAQEEKEEKGFVDYQENKAVLPNGITIDLNAMGKKSKRPFRSPSKS